MAKPTKRPTISPPAPPPAAPTSSPAAKPALEEGFRRISFLVGPNGTPAVDRMHQDTRQQLRELVAHPGTAGALGISTAPPASGGGLTLPPFVGIALAQAVSIADYVLVAKLTGAPKSVMDTVGVWTEGEQESIREPLLALTQKYCGQWIGNYGEEFAACATFMAITMAKIQAVKDAMEKMGPGPRVVPITSATPPPAAEDRE